MHRRTTGGAAGAGPRSLLLEAVTEGGLVSHARQPSTPAFTDPDAREDSGRMRSHESAQVRNPFAASLFAR